MTIAITLLTLVADMANLGTDTGLVNFVGRNFVNQKLKAYKFLKLGLEIKIVVWAALLLVGWFACPWLAETLFAKSELTSSLRISLFGVGGALLFSFITHSLQGMQRFWAWSGIQISTNALRVAGILVLVGLNSLNLETGMAAYAITPFLGFLIGIVMLPRAFITVRGEKSVAKEFFRYNKWVALLTLVTAFSARLDTFISARLISAYELGLYSLATKLTAIVPQIVVALGTVFSPKMASMGSLTDYKKYFKKTLLMTSGMFFLGLLSIPAVLLAIPFLFGNQYNGTEPLFVVHMLAMLIFLISVPFHASIYYYFSKPKFFFWLSLVHLIIIAGIGWLLISAFGAMGASVTVLIGSAFNFVIPAVWVLRTLSK